MKTNHKTYSFSLLFVLLMILQLSALAHEYEVRMPIDSVCPSCINEGYEIVEPGSYYLTRDLITEKSTASGSSVIVIRIISSNVTLDLNGFTIAQTNPTIFTFETGIQINGFTRNVVVKNGTIKGFGYNGITGSSSTQGSIFQDLIVTGNGRNGIDCGDYSTFINVVVNDNLRNGLEAEGNAQIRNCTAIGNGEAGFQVREYSQIFHSSASENGTYGIYARASNNTIDACHAEENAITGIYALGENIIRNCICINNRHYGINSFGGSILNCIVNTNGACVTSTGDPCISAPTLGSNGFTTAPFGTGIAGKGEIVISGCHANAK